MLVRRGARAGPGMLRGWTALCLLSLLPSGFTHQNNSTTVTLEPTTQGTFSNVPATVSSQSATMPSTLGNTSPFPVSQDTSGIPTATPATNFTSTSGTVPVAVTTNSSAQSRTSVILPVITTPANSSTSVMTSQPNFPPVNVSSHSPNSTSPMMTSSPGLLTPSSPTTTSVKGEIKCSGIREVRLTQAICLELNETSNCEEFKKDKGEDLVQILCGKEAKAEPGVCSLLLAQSEVKPQCILLVLANRTELSGKLQLMEKHQSDLKKLGIQGFTEQDVGSHQNYSRKTLIALVTSGILLAVLGATGYFLMNRRSWSPAGERLELEP